MVYKVRKKIFVRFDQFYWNIILLTCLFCLIYLFLFNEFKEKDKSFSFIKSLILEILVTWHSQIFIYIKKYLSIWHLQKLCSKRFIALCLVSSIFNPVEDGRQGKNIPASFSFVTSTNVGISPQKFLTSSFNFIFTRK